MQAASTLAASLVHSLSSYTLGYVGAGGGGLGTPKGGGWRVQTPRADESCREGVHQSGIVWSGTVRVGGRSWIYSVFWGLQEVGRQVVTSRQAGCRCGQGDRF